MRGTVGLLGAALLLLPVGDVAAKKKDKADAAADAAPGDGGDKDSKAAKVVTKDKTDLRAEGSDLGKVVKHLKKGEKLDFVSRSPDGKWAQVKKGKTEGWVAADVLDGLPEAAPAVAMAPVGSKGADGKPTTDSKPATADAKPAVAAKPPEPTPEPAAPPPPATPPPPPEPAAPVAATPAPAAEPDAAPEPAAPKTPRDGLRGFMLSIGGGAALLNTSMAATTSSGLVPELFNYHVDTLPGLSLQARVGYLFGWKWLRIGADAGYRFSGGTSIVIQLPDRDSIPSAGQGGSAVTVPLHTARQELAVTSHDADAGISFGGYFRLPKRLEMSVRARGGIQFFGFIPEFNASTSLPQELFYGPSVGAVVDFQTAFQPGLGVRVEGGYIPVAVRLENAGLRDGEQKSSNGYYVGGGLSARILPGFEVELTYRLLSTKTEYLDGSVPERLARDRDPEIQRRAKTGSETLANFDNGVAPHRETGQHSINLNLVFFRR